MKLLIEVEAPGWDGSLPDTEAAMDIEIAAFVSLLVESRIRRKVKVNVSIASNNYVLVNADSLVKLQAKASALKTIVECEDHEISGALDYAMELLKA